MNNSVNDKVKKIIIISLVTGATLFHGSEKLMATELNQEDGIFPWHSTEYVRTLNRNASTDADAAFYNPAGLAMMEKNGLYVNFSNSVLHKKKIHTLDYHTIHVNGTQDDTLVDMGLASDTYSYTGPTAFSSSSFHTNIPRGDLDDPTSRYAEIFSPVLPDINIVYKASRWAAFLSIGVMQAAPNVIFGRGLATTDLGLMAVAEQFNAVANQTAGGSTLNSVTWETNQIVRNEMFISATSGFAYRLFDALSASAALRFIHYTGGQKLEITGVRANFTNDFELLGWLDAGNIPQSLWDTREEDWNVETTYKGQSLGVILGTDFRPFKDLNIGVRYEYYLPAKLKKKNVSFVVNPLIEATGQLDIFKDGSDNDAYTGTNGSSILKVTYPQSLSVGVSYQLLKSLRIEADGDVYMKNKVDLDGAEKDFNNAYRVGGCLEYAFNDKVVASLGYSYNNTGVKPETRTEIDPLLFNHTIGTGVGITVDDRLSVNLGLCYVYYVRAKVESSIKSYTELDIPISITLPWYLGGGTVNQESHITTDSTSYFTREFAEETMLVSFGATYRFGDSSASAQEDTDADDEKVSKKKEKKAKKEKKEKKSE